MPIRPCDLAELSRLLDAALALPAGERDAWLAALHGPQRRHVPALIAMLAEHAEPSPVLRPESLRWFESPATDADVARRGHRVGPYRLLREIGRGGMGTVWLATPVEQGGGRPVALKLPRLSGSASLVRRMAREREIGLLLAHPHIARLRDAGVDALGRPWLAFEHIDGQPIDAWCDINRLRTGQRLQLFLQVARAVAYVNRCGVVHRDLKPANILVTDDGCAHLLDFGIAKRFGADQPFDPDLTQELGRVMTPLFASPEQIGGERVGTASDVFSLGVLMHRLLTGRHPFAANCTDRAALTAAIERCRPPAPSVHARDRGVALELAGDLDAIVGRAIARRPEARYASADALADDIERHLAGEAVLARRDDWAYRLGRAVQRHWSAITA